MKCIIAILFCLFSLQLFSQKQVSLNEVKDHSGEKVSVEATIVSTRYIPEKAITLMNIGAAHPNQTLTLVIKGDDRLKFKDAPEEFYKGRNVLVTGIIEIYNGKPQIRISEKEQIILFYKG